MRTPRIAAIALLTSGCGGTSASAELSSVERSLSASERARERADELYDLTERDFVLMRSMASDLLQRVERTARDLDAASHLYREAAAAYGETAALYRTAADAYRTAAGKYQDVTRILIAAAASDLFVRGVCGRPVSTRSYRETLRAQGVDLRGKDIDHIIPRSRGGPDLPWNYNPLDASINRSLQANGMWWKLASYPLETLNAWAKYASYILMC